MKKLIIPRRDHEVYFLPKPPTIKNNKQLQQYVNDNMEKLHPAFSSRSKTDIKQIYVNNTRWLMITVMEEEILAEYKILNNHTALFSNTSIMLHNKDFINNGIKIIDDEKIGFDTEKNEIISFPLDENDNNEPQKLIKELKTVSVRYALFKKKLPQWLIPAISACLLLSLILTILLINNSTNYSNRMIPETSFQSLVINQTDIINQADIIAEKEYIPPFLEILASMAVDVFYAGGRILQWQCNKDIAPFLTIQLQGIDVLNIYRLFSNYNYIILQDIQEIRYGDNEPYITVTFNLNNTDYVTFPGTIFPMHTPTFNIITELSDTFINNSISIVSETLPAAANEYLSYSINFNAIDWNLMLSLETIAQICNKYKLSIKYFSISIINNRFHVSCTLSYSDYENFSNFLLGNEIYYIPLTFGYLWEEPVIANIVENIIEDIVEDTIEYERSIIGLIRDDRGTRTFYRDSVDGRMQVRVE